jgi:hypothetical protein
MKLSFSLSRGAGRRGPMAGRRRAREATATSARRPHTRRGPRCTPAPRGRAAADGALALRLRSPGARVLPPGVQDIDLARNQIVVHSAKGDKDRMTMLPASVKAALVRHLAEVREQHRADLAGEVPSGSSCRPPSRGSPPLVRHLPPRGPARHPDGPGASRPSRPRDHADLHSRPQPRSVRRPAPRRWDARRLTRATPAPIWSTKR